MVKQREEHPPWLHPSGGDVVLDIIVTVRASRTRIMGVHENRLKVQLAAAPTDNQANDALVRFVADTLKVSRAQVEITAGATSKRKTVRLAQVGAQQVLLRLSPTQQLD